MIKADGYGHGARAIARLIQDYDYIWGFATATAEEALELRHAGITKPVLILGLVFEEYYEELAANDIRVPIEGNDLDVTSFLAKQAVKSSSKLHVKAIITDSYTRPYGSLPGCIPRYFHRVLDLLQSPCHAYAVPFLRCLGCSPAL